MSATPVKPTAPWRSVEIKTLVRAILGKTINEKTPVYRFSNDNTKYELANDANLYLHPVNSGNSQDYP